MFCDVQWPVCESHIWKAQAKEEKWWFKKRQWKVKKTLEASITEYNLVNQALLALGVDINEEDISDVALANEKDLNVNESKNKTDGKSMPLDQRRVTFSSKEGKATVMMENEQKGEKEKKPNLKEKNKSHQ